MEGHYAELTLYQGFVENQGRCSNGEINPNATDEWNRARFLKAMQVIHHDIDINWGVHIIDPEDYVVKTSKEGEELCLFAEENILGACGIIKPVRSEHGAIIFYRKIEFKNRIKSDRDKLIKELKKSGHVIFDEYRDYLIKSLELIQDVQKRAVFQKNLDSLEVDHIWKRNWNFY